MADYQKIQAIIFRRPTEPEILLLKRVPEMGGKWQPLTGTCDPDDDDLLATLKRELYEEIGVDEPLSIIPDLSTFTFNGVSGVAQEHVYGVEVDPEVRITFEHNPCYEHVDHEWVPPEEALLRLPFETQQEALRNLLEILSSVSEQT